MRHLLVVLCVLCMPCCAFAEELQTDKLLHEILGEVRAIGVRQTNLEGRVTRLEQAHAPKDCVSCKKPPTPCIGGWYWQRVYWHELVLVDAGFGYCRYQLVIRYGWERRFRDCQ